MSDTLRDINQLVGNVQSITIAQKGLEDKISDKLAKFDDIYKDLKGSGVDLINKTNTSISKIDASISGIEDRVNEKLEDSNNELKEIISSFKPLIKALNIRYYFLILSCLITSFAIALSILFFQFRDEIFQLAETKAQVEIEKNKLKEQIKINTRNIAVIDNFERHGVYIFLNKKNEITEIVIKKSNLKNFTNNKNNYTFSLK